jgi:hypothetical protein
VSDLELQTLKIQITMKKEKNLNKPQKQALNIHVVIRRFSNWFKRNFICSTIFSNGHIPEPFLTETEFSIHTKICKRCKYVLGLGTWKHIPPPPNSTPEQIKSFQKYKEGQLDELRRSV